MKSEGFISMSLARFPQHVRAGERRMAAQVHFHQWREPSQLVPVIASHEERRLRQVHLAGHVLHPAFRSSLRQHAHGSRIACERFRCKSVDLVDVLAQIHVSSDWSLTLKSAHIEN